MENTEKQTSQFNEAGFQIQRLHNIWLDCKKYREDGLLKDYRWRLDSAEIELSDDTRKLDKGKKKDEDKYGFRLKNINKELYEIKNSVLKHEVENLKKVLAKIYSLLKEKEMLLREIQQAAGKGSKYIDSDEEDM